MFFFTYKLMEQQSEPTITEFLNRYYKMKTKKTTRRKELVSIPADQEELEINRSSYSLNYQLLLQAGHLTNPFSLQSGHLMYKSSYSPSAIIFRLPLQLGHTTNLTLAHPLHGELDGSSGIPSKSLLSLPCSCKPTTSSAPPMYLPFMKIRGGITLLPKMFQSSSLYSKCIETSLS